MLCFYGVRGERTKRKWSILSSGQGLQVRACVRSGRVALPIWRRRANWGSLTSLTPVPLLLSLTGVCCAREILQRQPDAHVTILAATDSIKAKRTPLTTNSPRFA